MKNIFKIEGKVALVTGSTGALGFTFARGLAQHGTTVILNGRNQIKLILKVQELKDEGLNAFGYVFDSDSGLGPDLHFDFDPDVDFELTQCDFEPTQFDIERNQIDFLGLI